MRNTIPNQKGFTLIEVMVAVLASVFIGFAVLTVFNAQHNQTVVQQGIGELTSNLRIALNLMDNDVNSAGYQFRDEIGVTAMNPRVAILEWDGAATNDNIVTGPVNAAIGDWATVPVGMPQIKAGTDAILVTTPFSRPNPITGSPGQSVCANSMGFVIGGGLNTGPGGSSNATIQVCNPGGFSSGCNLLDSLTITNLNWWAGALDSIDGTPNEPSLLVQWPDPTGDPQTLSGAITSVTYVAAGSAALICGGGPAIQFQIDTRGIQARAQDETPGTPFAFSAHPGGVAPVTVSLVNSYLYYISNNNQLVRIPAGHDDSSHTLLSPTSNMILVQDMENLQLQFTDLNGNVFERVDDANFGWIAGADPDTDTLKNAQRIAAVRIGLIGRTQLQEGLSHSGILKEQPLFNYAPASPPVDKFHRRIVMRTTSVDNVRLLP